MSDWRFIDGWLLVEEAELLKKYALEAPSEIVELGSYCGKSSVILGKYARTGVKVICVDTFDGRATNNIRDTYTEFIYNTLEYNIYPVKMTSTDFSKIYNRPISLLFIDADHSYNSVKEDFENYITKVHTNGIIIFHDALGEGGETENTPWQGVTDLYLELLKDDRVQHIENVKRCAVFKKK